MATAQNAERDQNSVPTLLAVASDDGVTPIRLYADPTTHRLLVDGSSGTVALTVGTTTIASGTTTRILYDNAGVLGEYTITGTGTVVVMQTSPTLITPVLGVATATSVNGLTITTTTGILTMTNAKTLAVTNTLTLSGTDSTTMTFPTTSATIARTDAGQTFTGVQVMTAPKILTSISDTNGNVELSMIATASAVNYVEFTNAATGTAGPIVAAQGETNIDLKLAAKGTGKLHNTTGSYGDITAYSPAGAGTATLTLNTSNIHTITMPAGNITIAVSNSGVGQSFMINIVQDSGGSRTVTWFTTIKWAGGSPPTLTTTANKIDTFGFIVTSAGNYQGYVVGQNL